MSPPRVRITSRSFCPACPGYRSGAGVRGVQCDACLAKAKADYRRRWGVTPIWQWPACIWEGRDIIVARQPEAWGLAICPGLWAWRPALRSAFRGQRIWVFLCFAFARYGSGAVWFEALPKMSARWPFGGGRGIGEQGNGQ